MAAFMLGVHRGEFSVAEQWQRFAEAAMVHYPSTHMRGEVLHSGGILHMAREQYEAARAAFEASLEYLEQESGPWYSATYNHAAALVELGRIAEATTALEHLLAAQVRLFGPRHPEHAPVLLGLGRCYMATHRYGRAEAVARRVLAARRLEHLDPARSRELRDQLTRARSEALAQCSIARCSGASE